LTTGADKAGGQLDDLALTVRQQLRGLVSELTNAAINASSVAQELSEIYNNGTPALVTKY
jgi:hypothetical protein